jgi:hypothetical protein
MHRPTRALLATGIAALGLAVPLLAVPGAAAGSARQLAPAQWDTGRQLKAGVVDGALVRSGRVVLGEDVGHRRYKQTTYDVGTWTSPWTSPGFGLTELIASWNASTPGDSWVEVRVRGVGGSTTSSWDVLGRWASGDRFVRRTSVSDHGDDLASVAVDTWRANDDAGLTSYQLQVRLMRRSGATTPSPSVDVLGAVASRLPTGTPPVSAPGAARGIVLDVPRYSQMAHRGHSPSLGGGGEAWCSPTSTAMVLGYYDALPAPRSYAWVGGGHVDPWVDEVARRTYDTAYEGTGNWPFNTAYAASRGLRGHITRLHSLNELETYIARGIPVITSQSFLAEELDGAGYGTAGHIMVVVGFTKDGDVIVNDPASSSNDRVRNVYKRDQFEKIWQRTKRYRADGTVAGGPGGIAYIVTPA